MLNGGLLTKGSVSQQTVLPLPFPLLRALECLNDSPGLSQLDPDVEGLLDAWETRFRIGRPIVQIERFRQMSQQALGRIQEVRDALRRGDSSSAMALSGICYRLLRSLAWIDQVIVENSLSREPTLNILLHLLEAKNRGEAVDELLQDVLNRCRSAFPQWLDLFDNFLGTYPTFRGQVESVVESLHKGLQGADSPEHWRDSFHQIREAGTLLDEIFRPHGERVSRAHQIPVIGHSIVNDLLYLKNHPSLSDDRVETWVEELLPQFVEEWDANLVGARLLLNSKTRALVNDSVDLLLENSEAMLKQGETQAECLRHWYDIFQFEAEDYLPVERLTKQFLGSLGLAILADGVPDFLIEETLEDTEIPAPFRTAVDDYLSVGDPAPLLHFLETSTESSPPQGALDLFA